MNGFDRGGYRTRLGEREKRISQKQDGEYLVKTNKGEKTLSLEDLGGNMLRVLTTGRYRTSYADWLYACTVIGYRCVCMSDTTARYGTVVGC